MESQNKGAELKMRITYTPQVEGLTMGQLSLCLIKSFQLKLFKFDFDYSRIKAAFSVSPIECISDSIYKVAIQALLTWNKSTFGLCKQHTALYMFKEH